VRDFFRIVRFTGLAVFIIAYALLVHHVNASGQAGSLGAVLTLLPLVFIALALIARRESRLGGMLFLITLLLLAWWQWPALQQHTALVFWLQDLSLMLALFATFARTLLPGHKPLCVGFAEAIHDGRTHGGELPPVHAHYARQVTLAWALFFALMAAASTLLFVLAPLAVWSFFVNFLTLPLVALMFVAEYLVRRQRLPDAPRAHILAAVQAYRNSR
jgi:uncharacterized membrane protein